MDPIKRGKTPHGSGDMCSPCNEQETNVHKCTCAFIQKWQITHCETGRGIAADITKGWGQHGQKKDCFVSFTQTMNVWMRPDSSTQGSQAKLINCSCPSGPNLPPQPCVSSYVLKIQNRDPAHDKELVKNLQGDCNSLLRKVLASENVGNCS